LQYSLDNAAYDGDTILLLHDNTNEDFLLEFNETVSIPLNNLVIKSRDGYQGYNIKAANHLDALFDFKRNDSKIRLIGIEFSDVTFLEVNDKNITVELIKSEIKNSQKPIMSFAGTNDTSNTRVFITDSLVIVNGPIINHTSDNDELSLYIKDSQITRGIVSSTTTTSSFDMTLKNVLYNVYQEEKSGEEEEEEMIKIIKNTTLNKAQIHLYNLTITGNFNTTNFLNCSGCELNGTGIHFQNTTIGLAFALYETSATIDLIELEYTTTNKGFIYLDQTNLHLNTFNGHDKNSFYFVPVIDANETTRLHINELRLTDSDSFRSQLVRVVKSDVNLTLATVKRCNFTKSEVLRDAADGVFRVSDLHISNSFCHQAILVSWKEPVHNTSGTMIVEKCKLVNNTGDSTFIGVVDAKRFEIHNAVIKGNNVENIFFMQHNRATKFENLKITENTFEKCFELKQSNIDINGVNITYNKAKKHGKALLYENDDGKNFTISIQNFYSTIINHDEYDHVGAIFSIDITESSLTLKNVLIDVKDMAYQQIKGVHLKFKTLNTRVKPALEIFCPTNYNPSHVKHLLSEFYTFSIDCLSCPRGSYSMERGYENIKRIDNEGFDTIEWKNGNRTYLHQDTPLIRKCRDCPAGGNCTGHGIIKSLGNYYGGLHDKQIEFSPCPNSYCCTNFGQLCVNYTSCNYNRRGTLCGICDHGYYESYFSPKCIAKTKCTSGNQERFWVIFTMTALILTLVICTTKDFAIVTAYLLNHLRIKLYRVLQKLLKSKGHDLPIISNGIDLSSFVVYNNQVVINGCMQKGPRPRKFIFSAVMQILLSFFQIVSLISLKTGSTENRTLTKVINLFNLQIAVKEAEELCPSPRFTVIWKHFTKNVLFIVTMLLFLKLSAVLNGSGTRTFHCLQLCRFTVLK